MKKKTKIIIAVLIIIVIIYFVIKNNIKKPTTPVEIIQGAIEEETVSQNIDPIDRPTDTWDDLLLNDTQDQGWA